MKQELHEGMLKFKLSALEKYDLTKNDTKYTPLIISINYSEGDKSYAFISYCVFTRDSNK